MPRRWSGVVEAEGLVEDEAARAGGPGGADQWELKQTEAARAERAGQAEARSGGRG